MAKRSVAMLSHYMFNMLAPRLRRGLGTPTVKPRLTEHDKPIPRPRRRLIVYP